MTGSAAELRKRLAIYLLGKGAVRSPEWERTFASVPRHLFVPRFFHAADSWAPDRVYEEFDESNPRWLELAYTDTALVVPSEDDGRSSSSTPSIMAYMLEGLGVEDGNTVLEIGLGSGYQAALLSDRLGSERVTSVDVDPVVFEQARQNLAAAGYQPHVALTDGAGGYQARAPYDRIIGAVYGWPIPPAWIRQLKAGGRLCAIAPSSLAMLTLQEDGRATGPIYWTNFGFMPLRGHNPPCPPREAMRELPSRGSTFRASRYPITILEAGGDQRSFWVLVGMLVLPHDCVELAGNGVTCWLDPVDGSWAVLDYNTDQVKQGGPTRLWNRIEELYDEWCSLGAPNRERFGLTVEPDGRHTLWLDDPTSGRWWDVTPSAGSRRSAG